jgi:hypothetical protein
LQETRTSLQRLETHQYVIKNDSEEQAKFDHTYTLLTLFTTWKDIHDKHLVHQLTLFNWNLLKPLVTPVIFTNETLVAEKCLKHGFEVRHISFAAAGGIPVLKYMFTDVMQRYASSFYAYSNGDILFTETLIHTLTNLKKMCVHIGQPLIILGKRTNIQYVSEIEGSSWSNITKAAKDRGRLFTGWAGDYFITSRSFPWQQVDDIIIGCKAVDNWLVLYSRRSNYTVIDVTKTVLAVHQTSAAGNTEGNARKSANYNINLLQRKYNAKINFRGGMIDCIEKYTTKDDTGLTVKARLVPKYCTI